MVIVQGGLALYPLPGRDLAQAALGAEWNAIGGWRREKGFKSLASLSKLPHTQYTLITLRRVSTPP